MDYETQAQQYQGVSLGRIGTGGYNSAGNLAAQANQLQPAQQDTLASLIGSVQELAYNLRANTAIIADSLTGPQPQSPDGASPAPQSALDILRMITYTMQAALGETNRAKRALGIQ